MSRNPVLPLATVIAARNRYRAGERIADLAREYRAARGTLYQAVIGTTWSWLDDPPPCRVRRPVRKRKRRYDVKTFDGTRCVRCKLLSETALCCWCKEEVQEKD